MIYPVSGFKITQSFGEYLGFKYGRHLGIDYATPVGTPVKAAQSGRIIRAGLSGDAGNAVTIQNGAILAKTFHMSRVDVKLGQNVTEGQVIGLSGNTGYSTGPHLHFQTEVNSVAVDPNTLIKGGSMPNKTIWEALHSTDEKVDQLYVLLHETNKNIERLYTLLDESNKRLDKLEKEG